MILADVLEQMRSLASEKSREGMSRFGINTGRALGIGVTQLRALGKEIGTDHDLALALWDTGIHEARILASIIGDSARVDPELMERWVAEFDSWDLCDQVCGNLFDRTPYAWVKAVEWSGRAGEFEKRAGFALMAWLAVHDKKVDDAEFEQFFPLIEAEADDTRNFVKKAVSWALRQIGKRSAALNQSAVETARYIAEQDSPAARWVARDALRELTSDKVREKLAR